MAENRSRLLKPKSKSIEVMKRTAEKQLRKLKKKNEKLTQIVPDSQSGSVSSSSSSSFAGNGISLSTVANDEPNPLHNLLEPVLPNVKIHETVPYEGWNNRPTTPLDKILLAKCIQEIEQCLGIQCQNNVPTGEDPYYLSSSSRYPSTAHVLDAKQQERRDITTFLLHLSPEDFFSSTCYAQGLPKQVLFDSVRGAHDEWLQKMGMSPQDRVEAALEDVEALYDARPSVTTNITTENEVNRPPYQVLVEALSQSGSLGLEPISITPAELQVMANIDILGEVSSSAEDNAMQCNYKPQKALKNVDKSHITQTRRALSSESQVITTPLVKHAIERMIDQPHLYSTLDPKDVSLLSKVEITNQIYGTTPYAGMPRHKQCVVIEEAGDDALSEMMLHDTRGESHSKKNLSINKEEASHIMEEYLSNQDVGFIESIDFTRVQDQVDECKILGKEGEDEDVVVIESGQIQLHPSLSVASTSGTQTQSISSSSMMPFSTSLLLDTDIMESLGAFFHGSNVHRSPQSEYARASIFMSIIRQSGRSPSSVLPMAPSTNIPTPDVVEVPRSLEEKMMRACLPGSNELECSNRLMCEGHIISSQTGPGFKLVSTRFAIDSLKGISPKIRAVFQYDICILCLKAKVCESIVSFKNGLRGPIMPSVFSTPYVNLTNRLGEYRQNETWGPNTKAPDGTLGTFAKYCRNNYARDTMTIGPFNNINSLKQVMGTVRMHSRVNF